jgi:hypothetical protein
MSIDQKTTEYHKMINPKHNKRVQNRCISNGKKTPACPRVSKCEQTTAHLRGENYSIYQLKGEKSPAYERGRKPQ